MAWDEYRFLEQRRIARKTQASTQKPKTYSGEWDAFRYDTEIYTREQELKRPYSVGKISGRETNGFFQRLRSEIRLLNEERSQRFPLFSPH